MKLTIGTAGMVLAAALLNPSARADIALQDFAVNINGTAYDYNNLGQTDPTTLAGMNASGFSSFTSGDLAGTGLGSLIYTFNPGAAGSYFVNFYFDESAGAPFYNEYGTVSGSAPAGMSWEIAQVNPSVGGIQFWRGTKQVIPDTLDNTNHDPVGASNYGPTPCSGSPCNADVATALGFSFTLAAGEEAVIDVTQSTTNPGGFYLEQVHPVDGNNTAETDLFLSGGISIQPVGNPGVPEPQEWSSIGIGLMMVGFGLWRNTRRAASRRVSM